MKCNKCGNQTDVLIQGGFCADCKREQSIKDDSIKKWIVFHQFNQRKGSIRLNKDNWNKVNQIFHYDIIQTDISGTVHLNIVGLIQ